MGLDHAITWSNRTPTRYVEKARGEADRASRLLTTATGGAAVAVSPVIATVGARVTGRGAGVTVVEADLLPGWLRRLPRRLPDEQVAELHTITPRPTTWRYS